MTTTPTPAEPATTAEDRALDALVQVIQAAASPAAQEAQALLLRRIALGSDIIPSRVPPPANITQVGGYLNLLDSLGRPDTGFEVVTSALGVAGSELPGGVTPVRLPLIPVVNDRPAGPAAGTSPANVLIRSDLAVSIQAAHAAVHAYGAVLPLWAMPAQAPLSAAATALDACGRCLRLLPTAALADPATDSLVLARPAGVAGAAYEVYARPAAGNAAAAHLSSVDLNAVVLHDGAAAEVHLGPVTLLPLRPLLAEFGWLAAPVSALPTGKGDIGWSQLTGISGLLPAVSKLGDELLLVRSSAEIDASAFASRLDWVWDGTDFIAPQS